MILKGKDDANKVIKGFSRYWKSVSTNKPILFLFTDIENKYPLFNS